MKTWIQTAIIAVMFFVAGEEIVPGVVDDLPEGRCAWAANVVNGGHQSLREQVSGRAGAAPHKR